jgi:hypothetical protein
MVLIKIFKLIILVERKQLRMILNKNCNFTVAYHAEQTAEEAGIGQTIEPPASNIKKMYRQINLPNIYHNYNINYLVF